MKDIFKNVFVVVMGVVCDQEALKTHLGGAFHTCIHMSAH